MDTGEKVAVKIMSAKMDRKTQQLIITEVQAMERLKHRHIIEQKEVGIDVYRKTSGKQIKVSYIIMELALGGELFDFIANSGPFQEDEARYYFKQFMAGLDFCHQNQVAHRDLKPENLLIGKNFDLKIADFGFAGPIEGRNGKGYLYTKLGTLNYMAPEIHLETPYQGKQVDLFSAAMILFIMVAQHPPFSSAQA
jgi:serine/threonine protein kinase